MTREEQFNRFLELVSKAAVEFYTRRSESPATMAVFYGVVIGLPLFAGYLLFPLFRTPIQTREQTHAQVLETLGINLHNAKSGICLCGQSGSGKTSILRLLVAALNFAARQAQQQLGILAQSVKASDPLDYARLLYQIGRRDVDIFRPGDGRTFFNPLTYLIYVLRRGAEDFATLLERHDESRSQGDREGSFWKTGRRETTVHAVNICIIAFGRNATLQHVYDVVSHVPSSPKQIDRSEPTWHRNKCRQILELAHQAAQTDTEKRQVQEALHYFFVHIPNAGEKVQGATVMHIAGLLAPLMRGAMYETVNCRDHTITPDHVLRQGRCVIIDAPVLQGEANHFINFFFGQLFAMAALSRTPGPDTPVSILMADEYQLLASPIADTEFQSVFGSHNVIAIRAFQSLSILTTAMSDSIKGKHQAQALLDNLSCKLFLSSSDLETQQFFSSMTGQCWHTNIGGHMHDDRPHPDDPPDILGVGGGFKPSFQRQLLPRKLGSALTRLRTGGPLNGFVIDGYVFHSGKRFPDGNPFKKFSLRQEF
jgi:hypothetical protein